MKNILYILTVMATIMLSSCLKDDEMMGPDTPGYVSNVVEFADIGAVTSSASSTFPRWTLAYDPEDEVTINLKVSYSGAETAPEDIKVTVVKDPLILDTYNEDNGSGYIIIPPSWMEIPNNGELTIKQGEKTATLPITVQLGNFSLTEDYGLPLKIESASFGTISGNFGGGLFAVSPKSLLDGSFDNTYSGSLGAGSNTQTFSTVSPILVSSNLLGIYSNEIMIYQDADDPAQVIEIVVDGLGGASVAAGTLDPSKNYYDESTGTLHLDYTLGAYSIKQTLIKRE